MVQGTSEKLSKNSKRSLKFNLKLLKVTRRKNRPKMGMMIIQLPFSGKLTKTLPSTTPKKVMGNSGIRVKSRRESQANYRKGVT